MKSELNRRDFIKVVGVAGGGLMLAVYLDACAPVEEATAVAVTAVPSPLPSLEWKPNIYLKMDTSGTLTVIAFRSEMGQGIRTALAMLAADELDMDWKNVRIEQTIADSTYGDQLTGGSVSLSTYHRSLRLAGAVARKMLVTAAAENWSVDPAECKTEAGFVIHPNGELRSAYAELVESASKLEVPREAEIKESSQWKFIGTRMGHWDAPQIVSGKAVYGLDVRIPGMAFAALTRSPVFGGTLTGYDDTTAKKIPGVRQVIELKNKVAVVADNSWAAIRGRNALEVSWDEGKNGDLSSESLRETMRARLPEEGTNPDILEAVYDIPFEAHATMEPMNCTVHLHDGICEVWAPTQNPQAVQMDVASVVGLPRKDVIVNVPLIGGGFGRRLQTDYAAEAAQVAQAINAPVQVVWTRDDDIQHDYYLDMTVQYVSVPHNEVRPPRVQGVSSRSFVPTGAWRSVENFPAAYATQCFIDEMAYDLGRDPLDLRLELYKDRAAEVTKLAAEKAGWGKPLPQGSGRGLAYHATFGVTHIAYVAEVTVNEAGEVRVDRVVAAVDCGQAVNPDNIAAQVEGGIVFGLTAALKAEATLKDGRIQQGNFHDYPLLQMDQMPVVEVYLVEGDHQPTGMGEMGVPPIAPAVANAIFAATGKRVRHIPIRPQDLQEQD